MCLSLLPGGRRGDACGLLAPAPWKWGVQQGRRGPTGNTQTSMTLPAAVALVVLERIFWKGRAGSLLLEPFPSHLVSHCVPIAKSLCKRSVVCFSLLRSLVAYLFLGPEKAKPAQVILGAWVMCMYCCDQKSLLPDVSYRMRWQLWLIRVCCSMPAVWEVFQKHWNRCCFIMDGGSQRRIFVFFFLFHIKCSQKNYPCMEIYFYLFFFFHVFCGLNTSSVWLRVK